MFLFVFTMLLKMSLWVISEISGLCVNTLILDDKYSFSNSQNLSHFLIIVTEIELKSLFLIGEIIILFVNTLTADERYSVLIGTTYRKQFKCNYLKNKKNFLTFWLHF